VRIVKTDLLRVSLSIGLLAATAAVACSNSSSGGSAPVAEAGPDTSTGTDSGAESGSGCQTIALAPSATGYVDETSINVVGAWFAYGDSIGTNGAPPGNCVTNGGFPAASCSSITFPPGPPEDGGPASFPQTTPGTMCLSGTAAQVIGTPPDYSDIFGIGIGLDFNNTAGTASTWDATMNHVTGLSFTVSGLPTTGAVRVEFQEPGTDVAPNDAWSYTLTGNGPVTVNLMTGTGDGDLATAFTVPVGDTEPPFDATMLEAVQFHVVTDTTAPITVSNFCISGLSAIVCGI
jgi:hypothetical protein